MRRNRIKIIEKQVVNDYKNGDLTIVKIAEKYNISHQTVHNIVNRNKDSLIDSNNNNVDNSEKLNKIVNKTNIVIHIK